MQIYIHVFSLKNREEKMSLYLKKWNVIWIINYTLVLFKSSYFWMILKL